jgi:predicted dehydrogenase
MNVGLIGCGRVAELHICSYKHIPEANVVAVSDLNLEKAKKFAKKYHIRRAYKDYLKILEMKDLDFVDICTPTLTHADLACEAAKFGHNILLEKPMARSTRECDKIIRTVSKQKVKLCICHNQLFIPHVMHMKSIIDSGEFDLIYLHTYSKENPEIIGPASSWIATPEHGGILWESGLHLAYLQLHFLKDITEVSAIGSKIKYPVHDQFSVLLCTTKQTIGVMEVSWFAKRPEALFEFMSSDGKRIQVIDYNLLLELSQSPKSFLQGLYLDLKASLKRWVGPIIDTIRKRELLKCLHHYGLISAFMSSMKNDSNPPVTPEDGRNAIHLLECIQQSLETNQTIKVKEFRK